jgi:excisionase family DNA binding protein
MTVAEAAKYLEVAPSTVYALCKARKLAHHRVGRGRGAIRLEAADLDAYRAAGRVEAEDAGTLPISRRPRSPDPMEKFRRNPRMWG